MEPKKIGPGRPKGSKRDTKAVIQRVASRQFAEYGYEKTTIRTVAEDAGVDPKLVMHYFGNKETLFASSMKLPPEATTAFTILNLVPKRIWGARIADLVWLSMKTQNNQALVGIIRASSSEARAAAMLRDFYVDNLFSPMLKVLKVDNKEVRAVMLSSLLVGVTFNREILGLFENLEIPEKKAKLLFGKAVQALLTSEL